MAPASPAPSWARRAATRGTLDGAWIVSHGRGGSQLTEDGGWGEDRGEHANEKLELADPFQGDDARAVGHRRSGQPADSSRSSSAG
jgi:hypothetical protein